MGSHSAPQAKPVAHTMVVKTELCNYSGFRIYPGHDKKFVRADQKMFTFINSKCEACFSMKRKNLATKWTVQYRRIHKKGTLEEAEKRRRAKKTVVNRREVAYVYRNVREEEISCWSPSAEGQAKGGCIEGAEKP